MQNFETVTVACSVQYFEIHKTLLENKSIQLSNKCKMSHLIYCREHFTDIESTLFIIFKVYVNFNFNEIVGWVSTLILGTLELCILLLAEPSVGATCRSY